MSIPIDGIGSVALTRLRRATPRYAILRPFSSGCVGGVDGDRIRVLRYRPLRHQGFRPVLYARLVNDLRGSHLAGQFRASIFTRLFMSLWFGFVVIMIPIFWLGTVANGDPEARWALAIAPVFIGLFGYALLLYSQTDWSEDVKAITDHVDHCVGAVRETAGDRLSPRRGVG